MGIPIPFSFFIRKFSNVVTYISDYKMKEERI